MPSFFRRSPGFSNFCEERLANPSHNLAVVRLCVATFETGHGVRSPDGVTCARARTKVYIVIAACVLAGIKTIMPFPYVSTPYLLGYKAGCSFAPISTGILVLTAAITFFFAKKKNII